MLTHVSKVKADTIVLRFFNLVSVILKIITSAYLKLDKSKSGCTTAPLKAMSGLLLSGNHPLVDRTLVSLVKLSLKPLPETTKMVGIDVVLEKSAIRFTDKYIENPRYLLYFFLLRLLLINCIWLDIFQLPFSLFSVTTHP